MPIRTLTDRLSLRHLLTLPYVVLVLALVLLMGGLSWRAGRDTVDTLASQLLAEAVNRIGASLARHIGGADAVLEAAFPTGLPAPADVEPELAMLRERFWLATSVHRDPNNYVYYGDQHGHFLGLWRFSDQEAELRLRTTDTGPRTLYRLTGIHGALRTPTTEDRVFEPRERPWYRAALAHPRPLGWTPVYVDFKAQDLVTTRTKRVAGARGETEGVVATDLPLRQVNALLSRVTLSENAVALVVEADGQLIGVSRGAHLQAPGPGSLARLHAGASPDRLVADAYAAVQRLTAAAPQALGTAPRTASVADRDGRPFMVGFARVDPALDLGWTIIVAAPREDFLAGVERNFVHAGLLAAVGAAIALALGWAVLGIVTRELRRLADAARRLGDGMLDEPPEVHRNDELGDLARSFADMQRRLQTDPLTGLCNRSALLRRVEDRILQQRRRGDHRPFALMFVDFDRFKDINERFGHTVGDAVLKELGQRLRASVRAADLVARYAGDDFVLMLDAVEDRAGAEAVRQHLETELRQPLQSLHGQVVDVSIGIALHPQDGDDTLQLIRQADADMYARQHAQTLSRTQALELRNADPDRRP